MIKNCMSKKLKGLKDKMLSTAGKEILIKVAVQSILTYIMSYFLLPSSLHHELESTIANFWWGQNDDERKIHWA